MKIAKYLGISGSIGLKALVFKPGKDCLVDKETEEYLDLNYPGKFKFISEDKDAKSQKQEAPKAKAKTSKAKAKTSKTKAKTSKTETKKASSLEMRASRKVDI
jgi:hypothetical protein